MITTNVSGIVDNWSNYFSSYVGNYAPESMIAKSWSEPRELERLCRPCKKQPIHRVSIEVTKKTGCKKRKHVNMPCFNQHKPYGVASSYIKLAAPFVDDDRPDWQKFKPKKRKPMLFEEVFDENGCSRGPHGTIKVKPVEPTLEEIKSEEIDPEITL